MAEQPPRVDVELRFTPAAVRTRDEENDFARAIYAALDAAGGKRLEARLRRAEPAMLEWLSKPETAAAFALDPLGALERLDAPVEPDLIEALRAMSAALATRAERPDALLRLVDAGVQEPPR
jgi:hypothetical protein